MTKGHDRRPLALTTTGFIGRSSGAIGIAFQSEKHLVRCGAIGRKRYAAPEAILRERWLTVRRRIPEGGAINALSQCPAADPTPVLLNETQTAVSVFADNGRSLFAIIDP